MNESKEEMLNRLRREWAIEKGLLDPRRMQTRFFPGAIHLDYASALKANVERQNYTVYPRYWYIDAKMRCELCGCDFCFTAIEQATWFEEYELYIDAFPKLCTVCRRHRRDLKALRSEYDRDISAVLKSNDCEWKSYVLSIIDRIVDSELDLPVQILENQKLLGRQIARRCKPAQELGDGTGHPPDAQ